MPENIEYALSAVIDLIGGSQKATHNYNGSGDPGVTDDSSKGYSPGSVWFKSATADIWVCTDATAGAAAWAAISGLTEADLIGTARTFTEMQGVGFTTLADGSTAWDMSATTNNIVITLDENTTLGFPSNLRAGSGIIKIIQGSTKRTFAWHASYKAAAGTLPTVTDANDAVDVFAWACDGTNVYIGIFGQAQATA